MYEGKKVFFILPQGIVKEHLIHILYDNEYEVYLINNPQVLDSLASRFPDSVIYVNIDSGYNEYEWKKKIKELIDKYPGLLIGILSSNISNAELAKTYIMDVGVTAGVIQLRQGVKDSSAAMLKILEASEARGRRKYLRYNCTKNNNTLNFDWYGKHQIGTILDISSLGFSCSFDEPMDIAKNQVIPNVQLKLSATLITSDCICLGSRDDQGTMIYVLIFKTSNEKPLRSKVRHFIYTSLQKDMDNSLSSL